MIKLSNAVALPDCKAKKMQCFRGDLDAMCAQLKALAYDGVELFARNPDGAGAAGHAVPHRFTAIGRMDRMGLRNRQDEQDGRDEWMKKHSAPILGILFILSTEKDWLRRLP